MSSARRRPPPVLALTAGDLLPGGGASGRAGALAALRAAVDGGLRGVLVREPDLGDCELLELLRGARAALGPDGWLGVHDRAHLAAAAGADGVHVGFRSLRPDELRRILPPTVAVGLSTHEADVSRAREDWAAADYVFHGPVHATPSKRGMLEPIGLEALARAVEASPRPVWALGGLGPSDAAAVRAAGCGGFAVLSGILPTPDPRASAAACVAAWDAAA